MQNLGSWYWVPLITDLWFKGTFMQIEKALINDRLCVSKASWKFRILTIYNFAIIYPWNLLLKKSSLLFNSFYCFPVYKQNFTGLSNLKTRSAMNTKISVFAICVEAITYLLLYTLHDCIFTFTNCFYFITVILTFDTAPCVFLW